MRRFDKPLALVEVHLPDDVGASLADLDDPRELVRLGLAPGLLASSDRARTQAAAERIYASGASGLRWWSALNGDWHAVVLFLGRVPVERLEIDTPELLTRAHDAVVSACRWMAMRS